jgi:hypothetical protein
MVIPASLIEDDFRCVRDPIADLSRCESVERISGDDGTSGRCRLGIEAGWTIRTSENARAQIL